MNLMFLLSSIHYDAINVNLCACDTISLCFSIIIMMFSIREKETTIEFVLIMMEIVDTCTHDVSI